MKKSLKPKLLVIAIHALLISAPQVVFAAERIELAPVDVTAKRIADDIVRESSTATKT